MKIGNRSLSVVMRALYQGRHYKALACMFSRAYSPLEFLYRYLTAQGSYPYRVLLRGSSEPVAIEAYSHHDLLTINEIFFRDDYAISSEARCVVDIGSNIGISALYFLQRAPESTVYLYEPVPQNVERLKINVFKNRYTQRSHLNTMAVGIVNGMVSFGVEQTGRYGGIGISTMPHIEVPCCHIQDVLESILCREGTIDLLKIDTEGNERQLLEALTPELLNRISVIHCEYPYGNPPRLPDFQYVRRGSIITYRKRSSSCSKRM